MYLLPLAPVICLVLLCGSYFVRPLILDILKGPAYECGFVPTEGQTYSPFNVTFFVVGVLFLLFDLELLFVFPLALASGSQSSWGYRGAALFFAFLVLSLMYELGMKVILSFAEA